MYLRIGILCLGVALGAGGAAAQPRSANYNDLYCSGGFSTEAMARDSYVISGEEAGTTTTFAQGFYVFINRGASQGVKVGDEFLVSRPLKINPTELYYFTPYNPKWFRWEPSLRRAMGTYWRDVGKLRVTMVQGDLSIAQVVHTCDYVQRGDIIRPFEARTAPQLKTRPFDSFMAPSGREKAMVVAGSDFIALVGRGNYAYVNLGSSQGVKPGDYFRFYRLEGTRNETAYQNYGITYKAYGFGNAPRRYEPSELPQQNLGEGVVLRVSPNSSTVLVTHSLREIYLGDYAELENPEPIAEAAPLPPPAAAPAPARNRPPAMTCSADRQTIIVGERVNVSARASDPDSDRVNFAWRSSGGRLSGSGNSVVFDSTGAAPGRYVVTGRADDGRGGATDCEVPIVVQPAPPPAQSSKMNECIFRASSAGVDNVCKRILDDVATRLKSDPRARLVIVGYADPDEAGAARLAQQRGANTKQYLLSSGVADARVDVRAGGGQAGAGRQNRRVDFVWVPAGATY